MDEHKQSTAPKPTRSGRKTPSSEKSTSGRSPESDSRRMSDLCVTASASRCFSSRIRSSLIGGTLLFLALLGILSLAGCQPQVIRVPCGPTPGLLRPVPTEADAVGVLTNGQLAEQYRRLRDAVVLDNVVKTKLEQELEACQR